MQTVKLYRDSETQIHTEIVRRVRVKVRILELPYKRSICEDSRIR